MKALLLYQPYAGFIMDNYKTIETRPIKLPKSFINKPIKIVTYINNKKYALGIAHFHDYTTYEPTSGGLVKFWLDQKHHLVYEGSDFYLKDKTKYGWLISKVKKYRKPRLFKHKFNMGGIIYK